MATNPNRLNRQQLAEFLPNHQAIKAFEDFAASLDALQVAIIDTPFDAGSVLAINAFSAKPSPPVVIQSDSQSILANQIFGG